MMKKLLPIFAIVFLLISTPVFASNEKNDKHGDSKIEVKVNSNGNRGGNDNQRGDDENDDNHGLKLKLEQSDDEFEIRGEISSVSTNSFVIAGQTVNIDPSKVEKFKLKGILEAGNSAKVEGVVVDDVKYAKEIKLIGTGQGRFKFEINGVTFSSSPSPSVSATPSASPDVSPSPDTSPSPSPTPEVSASVKIKAVGPVDKVISFLQQVLGFLGNIGGSSPDPSPSPSPSLSPSVEASPSPSPTPDVSPSPAVSPSPTPEVSPSPEVTPSPSVSPSPSPSATSANIHIKLGPTPVENIIGVLGALLQALQNLI